MTTTIAIDVRVPVFTNPVSDLRIEVRFGRFSNLAGYLLTDDAGLWFGVYPGHLDEPVTDPVENRREAARLLVLDHLGGTRPPGRP